MLVQEEFDDAFGGVSVAVGVVGAGHGGVGAGVGEQFGEGGGDGVALGADEAGGAGGDAFFAFGGVAHDEDGFAEGGSLLLDAPGVGEDEVGAVHEGDKFGVGEGGDEMEVGEGAEEAVDGFLDVGVEVNGVDEGGVGEAGGGVGDGLADVLEAFAEAFTAVAGDEDGAPVAEGVKEGLNAGGRLFADLFAGEEEGVDDGVAGDVDVAVGDVLAEEGLAVAFGGGDVEIGEDGGDAAVDFFGEGGGFVAGAEAGLDVAEADAVVEGEEAADHAGGGVALDDEGVGAEVFEDGFEVLEDAGAEGGEALAGGHEVEVVVGPEGEEVENLIEHFAVLGGEADAAVGIGAGAEGEHKGGEFNGFGAGSEEDENFLHWTLYAFWGRKGQCFRPFNREESTMDEHGWTRMGRSECLTGSTGWTGWV